MLQEQTLVQAHTYAQETDLSKRVQEWDDRIRPQLQEEVSCCVRVWTYVCLRVQEQYVHN